MNYYLAIDIGASSGRHILCHIEDGKMQLEEVYRFKNQVIYKNGHYCWNVDYLFEAILEGIRECVNLGKIPQTMGIDTWAVDYILLDENDQLLTDAYAYRDQRNKKGVQNVLHKLPFEKLYQRTGIQFQVFNTLFQLKSYDQPILDQAKTFLMIPDYLHYLLTGKKVNEYTNMSTTQMLDIQNNQLDTSLLEEVDIPQYIFQEMVMPSTVIGCLTTEIQNKVGCQIKVVVPATHDTGSAYMAAIENNSIILSSGTWSLLGIETMQPYVNQKALQANFTNEGGFHYRYRFLKNIMGLWIIQEVARNLEGKYSFAQLVDLAKVNPFDGVFDVNDQRFLKPEHMIKEIQKYFQERNQKYPQSVGEIAYCVYHSLAYCYKKAIEELENLTQQTYTTINIIGGGCQNELLNEMIAGVTHKKVVAGPIEATALGNILSQLLSQGIINDLEEGRKMIRQSFQIKEYEGEKQ